MHATLPLLNALSFPAIARGQLQALQVNPATARKTSTSVMCKSLVSVDWQGYLYDRAFISRHLGKQ
jgi:hypothetical protein